MQTIKPIVWRVRHTRSRVIDRWLGIDTMTVPPFERRSGVLNDSVHYEPPDYLQLWHTVRRMRLTPTDVVYEIGCGLGRVVCDMARRPVERVVGIELCPELGRVAESNAARLRGRRASVEIRLTDAAHAEYDGGTAYFMFNPFGAATMSAVMDRIRESLDRAPRSVRVVYMNPLHADVLDGQPWLECRQRFKLPGFRSGTHIYESR